MLAYICNMVNLGDFDNYKMRRGVLPRKEGDYKRARRVSNKRMSIPL